MKTTAGQWMFFLGALMLLFGAYGLLRIIHVNLRKVPYPSLGVFPPTVLLPGVYSYSGSSRESECEPYPQVYYDYDKDGKQTPREQTEEERVNQEQLMKRCIDGFNEDRSKQEQRDKNQATFLLFTGAGLIFSRRFLD